MNSCYTRVILVLCMLPAFFGVPQASTAQISTVYFLEVTNSIGGDISINDNLQGDNQFNKIRSEIFLNSWISNEVGVFIKILLDEGHRNKFRVDGAYFLFDLKPQFKAKVGRIPFNIGNFPMRNYLENNPLMYQYRSAIQVTEVSDNDRLLTFRGKRKGVTFVYEACWDSGIELLGEHAKLEYSFAVTNASVFSPKAKSNTGEQVVGRIGLKPVVGMRMGIGYARAPYLSGEAGIYGTESAKNIPEGKRVEDYTGELLLADFEYTAGHLDFFAEWAKAWFESGPKLEKLSTTSYFLEAKCTLNPRWYAAGRFGQMLFEDITTSAQVREPWDYDTTRLEIGLGYKINRKMVCRSVGQFNWFSGSPLNDIHFFALQLKAEL